LHIQEVLAALITGESGAGKSFLANYLLTHYQKYRPILLIMDIGGSYRDITHEFGGSYIHIDMQHSDARINPFSLEPTEGNIKFLAQFVRMLLSGDGGAALTDKDHANIFEACRNLCDPDMPRELRRLSGLSLPPAIYKRLGRWMQGGEYGRFFDNAKDDLQLSDWQTFDFQGMEKNLEVLTPLMFYITQRFDEAVYDPALIARPKLYVNDEGWRFLLMGETGKYIVSKMKTGRKHNLGNLLITQSGMDAERAGLGDLINEACPMKIFLANPEINAETYRRAYGLNEREARIIKTLIPKRQLLVHTPTGAQVLNLRVDAASELKYSTDPQSTDQKMKAAATAGGR
jgi:type IV secretion system protein VirB4